MFCFVCWASDLCCLVIDACFLLAVVVVTVVVAVVVVVAAGCCCSCCCCCCRLSMLLSSLLLLLLLLLSLLLFVVYPLHATPPTENFFREVQNQFVTAVGIKYWIRATVAQHLLASFGILKGHPIETTAAHQVIKTYVRQHGVHSLLSENTNRAKRVRKILIDAIREAAHLNGPLHGTGDKSDKSPPNHQSTQRDFQTISQLIAEHPHHPVKHLVGEGGRGPSMLGQKRDGGPARV